LQHIVHIGGGQFGHVVQAHLLQALQHGFADAFFGEQGLGFFEGKHGFVPCWYRQVFWGRLPENRQAVNRSYTASMSAQARCRKIRLR
jgi:hypothetical protein